MGEATGIETGDRRRADVAATVFALVFPSLLTWAYFVLLADAAPRVQQAVYGVGKTIQFAFPILWVVAVQRERLRAGALVAFRSAKRASPVRVGRGVLAGVAFGAAVFAAALVLYHGWLKPAGAFDAAGDAVRRKVAGFDIRGWPAYAGLALFYSLGHSFLEEYYWRWFVFGQLRRRMDWRAATAVSSLGFMAHHVLVLTAYFGWASPFAWGLSLCVAVGGAAWAWLYHRGGSLLGPWLSHLLVDAAIFAIGYDLVGAAL